MTSFSDGDCWMEVYNDMTYPGNAATLTYTVGNEDDCWTKCYDINTCWGYDYNTTGGSCKLDIHDYRYPEQVRQSQSGVIHVEVTYCYKSKYQYTGWCHTCGSNLLLQK